MHAKLILRVNLPTDLSNNPQRLDYRWFIEKRLPEAHHGLEKYCVNASLQVEVTKCAAAEAQEVSIAQQGDSSRQSKQGDLSANSLPSEVY